jgi:hypothetical protein
MAIVPKSTAPTNGASFRSPRPRIRPDTAALPSPAQAAQQAPAGAPPVSGVGYKNPPVHTRFKPGQSGNPRGRPKGAKGIKTIVRELLTEKVLVRTALGEKKISRIEVVIQKTIELAMKGNARALAQLISLYSAAVPEAEPQLPLAAQAEDLTAADIATLEELKALLASGGDLS